MKAIRIYERGSGEVMKLEELAVPSPGPGEVLIKVVVAGVNYSDIGQRRGDYPNLMPLPMILGNEVAGVVVSCGPEVTAPAYGERVVALVAGGYAEYALAPAAMVVSIPAAVSFAQAVVVPIQGQTAYLLLDKAAQLSGGERVLVHAAAGGVGTLAVQLARLLGASQVIGTTRNNSNFDYVRQLGADLVVNSGQPSWVAEVMKATQGEGVDIILDAIGGPLTAANLSLLAPFGRMVVFGALGGAPPSSDTAAMPAFGAPGDADFGGMFNPAAMRAASGPTAPLPAARNAMPALPVIAPPMLIPKCLSVSGYNTVIQAPADQLRASHAILKYIASGQLQITLNHSYPLAQAASAHQAIETQQTRGKVILNVSTANEAA